jgi:dienelactone hydrolase
LNEGSVPRGCLFASAVVFLGAACGGGTARSSTPGLFDDGAAPLRIADRSVATGNPRVRVRDVSFAGRRGRVYGYLAVPTTTHGRLGSVVLLHGTGGSRRDFLPYAVTLAGRGLAALTLTAPSSTAPAPASGLGPRAVLKREQQLAVDDVVAVRRAVDFLQTRPSLDPRRIGLLGWSSGARTGAVVAGVERRIRAFVLMSGGALPVSDYVKVAPVALRADIRKSLGAVDPLRWIARARPGTLLLENGRHDEIVPRRALLALAHAAPPGTTLRWYDAGHRLNRKAVSAQSTWLLKRLAGTR